MSEKSEDKIKCSWCGKYFIKKHHSEKYCSDTCRKEARVEQSRHKSHRWYHRHKHELSEKQRWGLGSGLLGQHRTEDFEEEYLKIQNEFRWLHLRKKY